MIYLASQSPRRAELLTQIGVTYELLLADASEDAEGLEVQLVGEAPEVYVQRVTALKLQAAVARMQARGLPVKPVLCADTTVALDGAILGKPVDAADATTMLKRLSGRTHTVFTAIALTPNFNLLNPSKVTFVKMTDAQIATYIATGEAFGKAGSYGIQGFAACFIEKIEGSYSGIMGLPLFETATLLRRVGVLA